MAKRAVVSIETGMQSATVSLQVETDATSEEVMDLIQSALLGLGYLPETVKRLFAEWGEE